MDAVVGTVDADGGLQLWVSVSDEQAERCSENSGNTI